MSLYSHQFDLLPKPSRSVLSFGDEATRAQLPDFATVDELKTFVMRLFVYNVTIPGFFIQLKVGASLICALIFVVTAIIGRRMYDRSFWIIRIMKRPSGAVLVPNAMLCFSIIEGLYGIIFVALMWEMSRFYESQSQPPINFQLWLLFPWIPLIIGAMWAAWGTYFATPSRTQSSAFGIGYVSIVQRFFEHAIVINSLGLLFPVVIAVSIVVPAVLADRQFNKQLMRQQVWLNTYDGQADFTQEMVRDAQSIWYALLDSMKIMSATYIIWVAWALAMFFVYSIISFRLMRSVRHELQKSKASMPRYGVVTTTRIVSSREDDEDHALEEANGRNDAQTGNRLLEIPGTQIVNKGDLEHPDYREVVPIRDARKASLLSGTTANHATPATDFGDFKLASGPEDRIQKSSSNGDTIDADVEGGLPMRQMHSVRVQDDRAREKEEEEMDEPAQRRTYMPNIIMKQQSTVSTKRPTHSTQMVELRKALLHISIQFFAISPACLCFMAIALLLAVTAFGGTEQPWNNGNFFERSLEIALVSVTWVTCLFGGVTVLAIAQRTYEPVFNNLHFSTISQGSTGGRSDPSGGGGVNSSSQALNGTEGPEGPGSPQSPRKRHSLTLGRMFGPRHGSQSKREGRGTRGGRGVNHDRSTFFETHTRTRQQIDGSDDRNGSSFVPSSHDQRELAAQDESMIDVDGSPKARAIISPKAPREQDERDSLDLAHRGLFIERTVVTVEEESQDYDTTDSRPMSKAAAKAASSPVATRGDSITGSQRQASIGSRFSNRFQSPKIDQTAQGKSEEPSSATYSSQNQSQTTSHDDSDDEEYFRGGAGRRTRNSHSMRAFSGEPGKAY